MSKFTMPLSRPLAAAVLVCGAFIFLYATVLMKLGVDWWSNENYSHGLIMPFVIGMIVWREWDVLRSVAANGMGLVSSGLIAAALIVFTVGILGSELFTQRFSLILMLGGLVTYFFGRKVLLLLAVPFALLILSIPLPQMVFNRIAFPLQIWASQIAVWGIRLFEVPTVRKGNVIDILPGGSTQTISLEVVEACSGIRSMMTLVALAVILSYFTRDDKQPAGAGFTFTELLKTLTLMAAAILIAVITNAARVSGTGILTYYYGKQATNATWHDVSGWIVFMVAIVLLLATNSGLNRLFRKSDNNVSNKPPSLSALDGSTRAWSLGKVLPIVIVLVSAGLFINWFASRADAVVERQLLESLPSTLGEWKQKGNPIRFDNGVEDILRTSDYTMREYLTPGGRLANIYVGYYSSQKTGATYHSPQNCLPGAGWVMKDPEYIEITTPTGRTFLANRYIIENGIYREAMVYWYQGRGHIEANEYRDKLNTIWDSVTRRRSDGSIVRVMIGVGNDESEAFSLLSDLSGRLADELPAFVPE